jgi:hypothetical protein
VVQLQNFIWFLALNPLTSHSISNLYKIYVVDWLKNRLSKIEEE